MTFGAGLCWTADVATTPPGGGLLPEDEARFVSGPLVVAPGFEPRVCAPAVAPEAGLTA
jgi:hypothetical protein